MQTAQASEGAQERQGAPFVDEANRTLGHRHTVEAIMLIERLRRVP
jgi:hypothetical protein